MGDTENTHPVVVFVLDSGVNPDFVGGDTSGFLIQKNISHGSMVARAIREYSKKSRIISMQTESDTGVIMRKMYLRSLERINTYLQDHPETRAIVNISLGSYEYDPVEHMLIRSIISKGTVIVAAAGNDSTKDPMYPAGYYETVAVAQSRGQMKVPESNYGPHIDIACSGDITFIDIDPLPYQTLRHELKARGTSFSAPKVTALIAEICLRDPSLTPKEAVAVIRETARIPPKDKYFSKGFLGAGIMSRYRALRRIDPFHPLKTLYLPLIIGAFATAATGIFTVKYKWIGLALSACLWVIILPTLIMYGLVSAEIISYIRELSINNGYGIREWVCISAGIAGAAVFSKRQTVYITKSILFSLLILTVFNLIPLFTVPSLVNASFLAAVLPGSVLIQRLILFKKQKLLIAAGLKGITNLKEMYKLNKSIRSIMFITDTLSHMHIPESCSLLFSIWEQEFERWGYDRYKGYRRQRREKAFNTITQYIIGSLVRIGRTDHILLEPYIRTYPDFPEYIQKKLPAISEQTGNTELRSLLEKAVLESQEKAIATASGP